MATRSQKERTAPLRKVPREILSGAFVSQALQQMGILPATDAHFFLPAQFAMGEPPLRGWAGPEAAAATGLGLPRGGDPEALRRDREIRAQVRRRDEARWAHLPKIGAPPPTVPAVSAAAAASAPLSLSPVAVSSGDHASIRLGERSSLSSFSSGGGGSDLEPPLEGAAVLHIHAHGVARVGVEHQVTPPPPPPQRVKEEEVRNRSGSTQRSEG